MRDVILVSGRRSEVGLSLHIAWHLSEVCICGQTPPASLASRPSTGTWQPTETRSDSDDCEEAQVRWQSRSRWMLSWRRLQQRWGPRHAVRLEGVARTLIQPPALSR
ncbi:hypothetical protein DPEC_G00378900 [Dallia pectoralis]|nr:hypothetical protein DPEC_G00378900 [Dallia pectoralis]